MLNGKQRYSVWVSAIPRFRAKIESNWRYEVSLSQLSEKICVCQPTEVILPPGKGERETEKIAIFEQKQNS